MAPKAGGTSQVRFGKLLAVGMAIAFIWGVILLVLGIYVRFKFGSVLMALMGNIEAEVNTKAAINDAGQNLAPVATLADDVNMGSWPKLLGALIISSAILTILFSLLGIYAGLNHNKMILIVTVIILVITAFLILGLISLAADYDASFHVDARSELVEMIQKSYTVETSDSSFVFAMNSFMFWFQCCGISNVRDFQNLTFIEIVSGQDPKEYIFKVAPACCSRTLFNTKGDPMPTYMRIKDCAIRGYDVLDNLNNKGCYTELFNAVSGTASAFLALILVWDILVLVLTILTIMEIKPSEELRPSIDKEKVEAERKRMEEIAMREKEEAPMIKRFIPYAKISSFVHPDVNRIKSTEIW